jgi:ring-1,2-phenylacetyl-CoA epoxidase subunit PaaA
MFGPGDAESKHSAQSMAWKIKRFTNDELRQKFIDVTAPQAEYLGLEIPDDKLEYDEASGHYRFGDIDWQEFYDVLAGNGPCNRQRLQRRRAAHEEGAWVRAAALAYAAKRESRSKSGESRTRRAAG